MFDFSDDEDFQEPTLYCSYTNVKLQDENSNSSSSPIQPYKEQFYIKLLLSQNNEQIETIGKQSDIFNNSDELDIVNST